MSAPRTLAAPAVHKESLWTADARCAPLRPVRPAGHGSVDWASSAPLASCCELQRGCYQDSRCQVPASARQGARVALAKLDITGLSPARCSARPDIAELSRVRCSSQRHRPAPAQRPADSPGLTVHSGAGTRAAFWAFRRFCAVFGRLTAAHAASSEARCASMTKRNPA